MFQRLHEVLLVTIFLLCLIFIFFLQFIRWCFSTSPSFKLSLFSCVKLILVLRQKISFFMWGKTLVLEAWICRSGSCFVIFCFFLISPELPCLVFLFISRCRDHFTNVHQFSTAVSRCTAGIGFPFNRNSVWIFYLIFYKRIDFCWTCQLDFLSKRSHPYVFPWDLKSKH